VEDTNIKTDSSINKRCEELFKESFCFAFLSEAEYLFKCFLAICMLFEEIPIQVFYPVLKELFALLL
jgi:hypothetical protein